MLTDLRAVTVYSIVLGVLLYERITRRIEVIVAEGGRVVKNDIYDVKETKKRLTKACQEASSGKY